MLPRVHPVVESTIFNRAAHKILRVTHPTELLFFCVFGLMLISFSLKYVVAATEEDISTPQQAKTTLADEDVIDGTADDFERYEKEGIIILIGHVKINHESFDKSPCNSEYFFLPFMGHRYNLHVFL